MCSDCVSHVSTNVLHTNVKSGVAASVPMIDVNAPALALVLTVGGADAKYPIKPNVADSQSPTKDKDAIKADGADSKSQKKDNDKVKPSDAAASSPKVAEDDVITISALMYNSIGALTKLNTRLLKMGFKVQQTEIYPFSSALYTYQGHTHVIDAAAAAATSLCEKATQNARDPRAFICMTVSSMTLNKTDSLQFGPRYNPKDMIDQYKNIITEKDFW